MGGITFCSMIFQKELLTMHCGGIWIVIGVWISFYDFKCKCFIEEADLRWMWSFWWSLPAAGACFQVQSVSREVLSSKPENALVCSSYKMYSNLCWLWIGCALDGPAVILQKYRPYKTVEHFVPFWRFLLWLRLNFCNRGLNI